MFDRYSRRIHYLRISVTDLCNLRCSYCMPEEGVKLLRHEDILSFEEIAEIVKTAVELGFDKIRLTGGEPLVRRGIIDLVRMVAAVDGIKDLAMTTNGTLLAKFAVELRKAGLHRLNVSLDAIDPEKYGKITRGGSVGEVFSGIDAALAAGFRKVKLNCVIEESPKEPDALMVAAYAAEKGLELRYIRRMETDKGRFWRVYGGDSGLCSTCNRVRVTSSGMVLPCLFNDLSFSVRELGIREAILAAINAKPEAGLRSGNKFYAIGG